MKYQIFILHFYFKLLRVSYLIILEKILIKFVIYCLKKYFM